MISQESTTKDVKLFGFAYTELQTVVLPCLKIAEALIHGGRNSVAKVEEIPVSDTTVYRRSLSIGEDLENQPLLKLHLHGRLFCVRFFDKNRSGKVAFTQRRF